MSKIKKNRKKIMFVVLVVIILTGGIWFYNRVMESKEVDAGESNILEVEYMVEKGDLKKSITGSSSLEPSDVRIISSELEGNIEFINVEEGQSVTEDEVIANYEIESDDEEQQLEIDTAEYNLTVAKNDLRELYEIYEDLNIYAEYDGTVSFLYDEGDDVGKNSEIAEFSEVNLIKVESYFSKEQIENISIGNYASIFLSDHLITLEGKVVAIDNTPSATGGGSVGYLAEVEIEYEGVLTEGSTVKITVNNSKGTFISPYSGKAVSNDVEKIYSPYGGELEKVYFDSGEFVNEGDLLAQISNSEIIEKIQEQELVVEQKRIKLEELNEEDSTVTAPIDGTILTVYVDEDGYVEKGDDLFKLANLEEMEIIIDVDELDILSISKGQNVTVECDVFEGEIFTGKVDKISLSGSSQSGVTTYEVSVLIEDRQNMMAGMNVDAEILIEERKDALIVPVEAMKKIGNKYIVMTKDEEDNMVATAVEVGITNENFVEILSGINEGDVVYYNEIISTEDDKSSMKIPGMGGIKGGDRSSDKNSGGKN